MLTDEERKAVWRKVRGFRRSRRGQRRAELAIAAADRALTPEEQSELAELQAIDDALEKPLWDERQEFMDEMMAKHGFRWNESHTEIVRLDGSPLSQPRKQEEF